MFAVHLFLLRSVTYAICLEATNLVHWQALMFQVCSKRLQSALLSFIRSTLGSVSKHSESILRLGFIRFIHAQNARCWRSYLPKTVPLLDKLIQKAAECSPVNKATRKNSEDNTSNARRSQSNKCGGNADGIFIPTQGALLDQYGPGNDCVGPGNDCIEIILSGWRLRYL